METLNIRWNNIKNRKHIDTDTQVLIAVSGSVALMTALELNKPRC